MILGVIPARYSSKRFPGKVLFKIKGKPVVRWVWEGARKSKLLTKLVIATDDEKVKKEVESFGAECIMTKKTHTSGTERCFEVAEKLKPKIVINIQGDEVLIKGRIIDLLIKELKKKNVEVVTAITTIKEEKEFYDPNVVKVTITSDNFALYFSRSPIPNLSRFSGKAKKLYKHIGIYGYKFSTLKKFIKLKGKSNLEKIEKLEQLRFLENGIKIKIIKIKDDLHGIDVP
ncbi:MAG: 3-deoxy-manno-octulosonate cytidylyltransferase, partial [Caldiserica bacterium]